MDTATVTNPYEAEARQRKCAAVIAQALRHYGNAATAFAGLTAYAEDDVWQALEMLAEVRPLSATSRAQVLAFLGTLADYAAPDTDPFAGLS